MAAENELKQDNNMVTGKGKQSPVKDLLRGASDPSTVQTYVTKGFDNSGVAGSTPVDRLTENGTKGITPEVMIDNKSPVIKIVKDNVMVRQTGTDISGDPNTIENIGGKGKSAGNVGSSNVNHA